MKTIKLKLLAIILAISPFITSAQTTETRQLESFNKVQSSGFFDVELTKGNEETARIVATSFPLDKLIMEVEGNTLKIYRNKYYNTKWGAKVKIYITYKQLEGVKNSGSGALLCKSEITGTESEIHSSGSGNIKIEGNIKADYVEVQNSGSGSIFLKQVEAQKLSMEKSGSGHFGIASGNVDKLGLSSSGSGNMMVDGLVSNDCSVRLSGSGSASVYANKSLTAKISGSGSIRYKGNPQLNSHISGSGRIKSF